MDFTLKTYKQLLHTLQSQGFSFLTFAQYIETMAKEYSPIPEPQSHPSSSLVRQSPNPEPQTTNSSANNPLTVHRSPFTVHSKRIILRHDVDARPLNSLAFARIQAKTGIAGTYYFRMVPQSYDENIIKEMVQLGHEVGYHYETMDTCKGDVDRAYDEFCGNLAKFQKLTPVKTISMHGSPMSPYDNREIWNKYDYKKLGIIAEPYFDINFNELFYITDTGRRWDGHLYNVRDKATKENPVTNPVFLKVRFHSTHDIIKDVENDQFPKQAMLNFHPQRWNDKPLPWLKEFFWQNVKNQGKRLLLALRK